MKDILKKLFKIANIKNISDERISDISKKLKEEEYEDYDDLRLIEADDTKEIFGFKKLNSKKLLKTLNEIKDINIISIEGIAKYKQDQKLLEYHTETLDLLEEIIRSQFEDAVGDIKKFPKRNAIRFSILMEAEYNFKVNVEAGSAEALSEGLREVEEKRRRGLLKNEGFFIFGCFSTFELRLDEYEDPNEICTDYTRYSINIIESNSVIQLTNKDQYIHREIIGEYYVIPLFFNQGLGFTLDLKNRTWTDDEPRIGDEMLEYGEWVQYYGLADYNKWTSLYGDYVPRISKKFYPGNYEKYKYLKT